MYVPLLHSTINFISGKFSESNSNFLISISLSGIKTFSFFLAYSYNLLPSFLIAEKTGGVCLIIPENFFLTSFNSFEEIWSTL